MDGGWFVYNDAVSYCSIYGVNNGSYNVKWSGQSVIIGKAHRFPTMLAAQLFIHRDKAARYVDDRKSDVMFYEELSRRFEEKAVLDVELHAKAWFVRWPLLSEAEQGAIYVLEHLERRPLGTHTSVFEVLRDDSWFLEKTERRFKTEPGARFHAEAKLLKERIEQEERLYVWLKDFGGRVEEHDEEIDVISDGQEEA